MSEPVLDTDTSTSSLYQSSTVFGLVSSGERFLFNNIPLTVVVLLSVEVLDFLRFLSFRRDALMFSRSCLICIASFSNSFSRRSS